MKKVTFVIQGPLCIDSIRNIPNYKRLGDVVVSCWDTDSPELFELIPDYVTVVKNKFIDPQDYNFQNIRYQIKTTLEGIKEVQTPYIVKVRSDEYFTRMNNFVSCVYNFPEHITVSNFLFRKKYMFHPSDHVFGGTVGNVARMFEFSLEMIEDFYRDEKVDVERVGLSKKYTFPILTAEMTFCLSYLKTKGIDVVADIQGMSFKELKEYHKKTIKENYKLVRASDMGYFLLRFKSNPIIEEPTAFTNEQDFLNFHIGSIKSLEEL